MNHERETITIETPIEKHQVVLKSYLTGREKRSITSVFLRNAQIDAVGKDTAIKGMTGSVVEEAENTALSTVIVSIDGTAENIVERVLDMHSGDYAFLVSEVNKITSDVETQKKTAN